MLNRIFYTGLAVVLVGIIAGQSYRYGRVHGELAAIRAQQQATVSQPPATPTPHPEQPITTPQTPPPVPLVEEPAERVARSNAAALARLYALQAAADAKRAQEAAATLAMLSQRLANVLATGFYLGGITVSLGGSLLSSGEPHPSQDERHDGDGPQVDEGFIRVDVSPS